MKFVEVCVLGNPRMTISINKGYSGVFELNISVYFTVCALNTSGFQEVMITYSRLEHPRIFSFSRSVFVIALDIVGVEVNWG